MEIQPVHSQGDQPWDFIFFFFLEGDNRGWDGWMASPTQCTWVWVNSRSWWRTGRPGVLRFMGLQRVRHDWAIELNWYIYGSPHSSVGKASACNAGDPGLNHELDRSSGEGNGNPLQYSCLDNPHGQRSLVGCSPWGRWGSDTTERLDFHFSLSCIGEGNGNPL